MKKYSIILLLLLSAVAGHTQISKTVHLKEAGTLSKILNASIRNTIGDLTITGNIDARDFKLMRDSMKNLLVLDLSNANIVAYSGYLGTGNATDVNYNANEIPVSAFYGQAGVIFTPLSKIILPKSTTSIANFAFSRSHIINISMPNSISFIGNGAFFDTPLRTFDFPTATTSIENSCFGGKGVTFSFTIPSFINEIKSGAFAESSGLNSLYVFKSNPIDLTNSEFAFWFNVSIANIPVFVPVGSKAAYTKANQWKDFTNIIEMTDTTVNISAGNLHTHLLSKNYVNLKIVGTINAKDFKTLRDSLPYLTNLDLSQATIVSYSGTSGTSDTSFYAANHLPKSALKGKALLQTISFPNLLTSIEDEAFSNCTNLKTVVIPNKVDSIGKLTFNNCVSLGIFEMPNSVVYLGNGVLHACNSITSCELPSSLRSVPSGLFAENVFNPITIPQSVTSFSSGAFADMQYIPSLRVLNDTPIADTDSALRNVSKNIPLYVPAGSKAAYSTAGGWKDFKNIIEVKPLLSEEKLALAANNSEQMVYDLQAGKQYIATSSQDWLHVSFSNESFLESLISDTIESAQNRDAKLWIIPSENTSKNERSAQVYIRTAGSITNIITINQAAAVTFTDEIANNTELIYPNPTTGSFRIGISAQIQIYTLDGIKMFEKNVESNASIDISNLSNGIYMIQITKDGKTMKSKILKM